MKARQIAATALIAGGVPLVAAPTWAHAGGGGDKVTLCHRTDADNNPYVQITVDPDAVFRQGHDGHDGPVWNPGLKAQHQKWGDIIPPFDYTIKQGNKESTGHYPGKNWTSEGQAIDANGCQIGQPASPSPTPTRSTSSPTSSPTRSSSASPTPSRSETSSASPTSSATSSPTPTASSSSSISSPTPTASTTVLPTSATRTPTTPTEVPSTPPTAVPGPTASPKPLPHTGSDTLPLVVLGVGMTGAGAVLARVRRR